MGTNYYLRQNVCNECGKYDELHIGKSSAGWHFALHIIPDIGITSLDKWKELFNNPNNKIYNEYNEQITVSDMIKNITIRKWDERQDKIPDEKFLRDNHAEIGLNGLLAHKSSTIRSVRTEGTYDLLEGEFS